MDWIVPLAMIVTGGLCVAIDNVLRRYISTHHDEARSFQKDRYYSVQVLSERFSRRQPLSWAMIAFGVFWSLTNLL